MRTARSFDPRGQWLFDIVDQIPDGLALAGAFFSLSLGLGLTAPRVQNGYEMQVWRPASTPARAVLQPIEPVTTF